MPGQAITYVIAGASGLSKAIPIQLVRQGSYRLKPYLRMLEGGGLHDDHTYSRKS